MKLTRPKPDRFVSRNQLTNVRILRKAGLSYREICLRVFGFDPIQLADEADAAAARKASARAARVD